MKYVLIWLILSIMFSVIWWRWRDLVGDPPEPKEKPKEKDDV